MTEILDNNNYEEDKGKLLLSIYRTPYNTIGARQLIYPLTELEKIEVNTLRRKIQRIYREALLREEARNDK